MPSVILITDQYPYGNGEKFIEDEIHILSERFEHVYILSSSRPRGVRREVPINCEICSPKIRFRKVEWLVWFLYAFKICSSQWGFTYFKRAIRFYLKSLVYGSYIRHLCSKIDTCQLIVYHYWKNATILWTSRALKKEYIGCSIISRAHGYDLYKERGFLEFRDEIAKLPKRIYAISQNGADYLVNNLNHNVQQIALHRLGVHMPEKVNPIPEGTTLEIVTLSYINIVKRLELLAEALKLSPFPIRWHLIGSGPQEQYLDSIIAELPDYIEVVKYGHLTPDEVNHFFETVPVHFLVNVSSSEGVPVSMMEALSWGVPIVATAVGGVPEIVKEHVGYLLAKNVTPKVLINKLYEVSERYDGLKYREDCKDEAIKHWNASRNYNLFVDELYTCMESS